MNAVYSVLLFQALMGALDNFWHHELAARLPQRGSARRELALHAMREAIYGFLFIALAWVRWNGAWLALPAGLLAVEVWITCADFLEEDRSRRLPPFERVLHTLLAVSYGFLLGALLPVFLQWAQAPTGLRVQGHGLVSWFFTFCGVGVAAWSLRNTLAVRRLGTQKEDVQATPTASGPSILVTGGTGFIGSALVRQLLQDGRRVIVFARDVMQSRRSFGPAVWVVDRLDDIPSETRIEAIVHLAGAPVLGRPWTRARRAVLLESRTGIMRQLLDLLRRLEVRPRVLVCASAVGFYGVPFGNPPVDEDSPPQPGCWQSELCAAVEHEARRAEGLGLRVVRLRFGIVLGHGGGAYPALAFSSRLGLGAVLGSGRQPVPWIHVDDAVGLAQYALACDRVRGAVNAVAPDVRSQAAFAGEMAASFGRRVFLQVPDVALRLGLGEMSEILRCGQHALPAAAVGAGYRFRLPNLRVAMRELAAG